jgi:hypothetical protein
MVEGLEVKDRDVGGVYPFFEKEAASPKEGKRERPAERTESKKEQRAVKETKSMTGRK